MTKSPFAPGCLNGRTALVTGGGSGIGFAIAQALSGAGAQIVLASRKADRVAEAANSINAAGGQAMGVVADVREPEAVQAAVANAIESFGGLDIVVANAAGNFVVPIADMSFNAWRTVVDIDLHGTFHCAKAAYPYLKTSSFGGRFIAITTMRALEGWPGCAHAAAAKAGVMSLIRSLAVEWGPDGILCNTIAPGPIGGTEGVKRLYEETGQSTGVPLGRLGRGEDIAQAALYLCSDASRFVTGTDLVVDGGRQRGGQRGGRMTELPMDLRGRVAHGDKRGRVLGFPTANLNARASLAYGVYASQTRIAGTETVWPSVTSYGTRPTFDGADQRIETHILDFQGDIYGCEIEVKLLAFIRPERRFESVDALIAAMQGDIEEARAINASGK